jgi:radical SAM superfamily enzyme YgiQ (UPF0313 family)
MTALLINPPSLSATSSLPESFIAGQKRRLTPEQYYSLPIEHLGLLSIASYARAKGIEVAVVNGMVAGHASLEETWQHICATARRTGKPRLIGFTNIDTFHEVEWLINRCRGEWDDAKIVLGHNFATLNYKRILREYPAIDYVVLGDGEVSFAALAEAVLSGRPVTSVPGLAWRTAMSTVENTPPTAVALDELPWPARDELPTVLSEGFAGAVFTTRGCLYRCTFCGTGAISDQYGKDRYRSRSIEAVVDEIEYLTKDFGIDFVAISDDLFLAKHPSSQERAAVFADEILRRQIKISFMFDARVDSISDLELLAHLKQAGLRRVFIGLETGSYEQLVNYRKRHVRNGDDPAARINALTDLGVEVIPGTIMFHPAVRPSELRQTLRLLKETGYKTPYKLFERMVAYAGTPLYDEYAAKGYLTTDWPIGEWEFVSPHAARMYDQTKAFIKQRADVTFEEAEKFFLARIAEWEAVEEDMPLPRQENTHKSLPIVKTG